MKKNYEHTQCLSYEQLKGYCEHQTEKEERHEIYKHLSGCELCATAVNGFSKIPFTKNDVNRIEQKMDARTDVPHPLPRLPFAEVLLVSVVLLFSLGYYVLDKPVSETKHEIADLNAVSCPISQIPEPKTVTSTDTFCYPSAKKTTPVLLAEKPKPAERANLPIEKLPTPAVTINDLFLKGVNNKGVTKSSVNDEVMYIEDFKVVDYFKIYIDNRPTTTEFVGNTPASKENKTSTDHFDLKEDEQKIIALEVLKTSLRQLKKQNYLEANTGFQLLIDKNRNDVNASFYSGICCFEMGNYTLAKKRFLSVLNYANPQFEQEATWKLALTCLKAGEKKEAMQLLQQIAEEDGFYAERAKKELK